MHLTLLFYRLCLLSKVKALINLQKEAFSDIKRVSSHVVFIVKCEAHHN